MKKSDKNLLKVVDINRLTQTPDKIKVFSRDIKYLKIKDVKRAYSKLIMDYCRGSVQNDEAKTLVYLFSGYLQLIRDFEVNERLKHLEKKILDELQ